ncbi:MAG: alpha/beta-type small acid-soluble spore protein [Defluviitaleaceae bacterium]|nr:alpha/beta-type small acid-soluble spore protein [Defluviitaleaceae bacterium]
MAKYEKTQNMKTEIANEFGVNLGPDATSRQNGSVGGEITKRLVSQALGKSTSNSSPSQTTSTNKSTN